MPVTLSITKASIRRHLSQVDVNSIDSLRNFVSLIDRGCSNGLPTASVPASSLTLLETFKYFGYTNDIVYRFGGGKPIIPENFRVVGSNNLTSYKKLNWLKESLETTGIAWNTNAEATRRIFIENILTAGLAELRILSDTTAPLHGFCEITLSCCVTGPTGAPLIVTGRCDMAVGYGTIGLQYEGQPGLETFLAIVEAKTDLTLQNALPQLLAYMGMVQAARRGTKKTNTTVYGFYSDGFNYVFVRLDNEMKVSRSRVLSILDGELSEVYAFVLHVLKAAQESSPSSSPTKPQSKMEHEVKCFPTIVEPKYFLVPPFEESEEPGEDLDMVV